MKFLLGVIGKFRYWSGPGHKLDDSVQTYLVLACLILLIKYKNEKKKKKKKEKEKKRTAVSLLGPVYVDGLCFNIYIDLHPKRSRFVCIICVTQTLGGTLLNVNCISYDAS